jgi:pimeloyl-ACP methyl ester carboxylesterase
MATCILVHGAFHGGWCWRQATPLIEARGHACVALDLPGHGADRRPLGAVTFDETVDAVVRACREASGEIWLVAHSLGGMIAAAAAAAAPEAIARIVYVAALVPLHGEAMQDLPQRPARDPVNRLISRDDEAGLLRFDKAGAGEALYNECSDGTAAWATDRLEDEAIAVTEGRVLYPGGRFPPIPRTYVACAGDRTITIERQEEIWRRSGCEAVEVIPADHSPFLSRPEQLAAILAV